MEGVELHFMGQKNLLARYPMHWHMMGPVDGQYFARSSGSKSFNRCVTVHGTDNARVEDNVCYDHPHGYFLEDGAETGNLIAGNLGLGTRTPRVAKARSRRTNARRPSGSPIRTIPSAAMPPRGRTHSVSGTRCPPRPPACPPAARTCPRITPLREFSNNVAH